jgi:capsular polysaccharide biosynthesis protein
MPNFLMNVVIGLALGAIFGVAAALLLENGDRRVRGDAEVVELLGLPLLGKIKPIPHRPKPPQLLLGAIAPRKAL